MSDLLNTASDYAVADARLRAARESVTAAQRELERAQLRLGDAELEHEVVARALLAAAQATGGG